MPPADNPIWANKDYLNAQVFATPTSGPPPPPPPATGTQAPAYHPIWLQDPPAPGTAAAPAPAHLFHVISAMQPYRGASFEELRMMDYAQNRKQPTNAQPAAASGFGGFGSTNTAGGFGQTATNTTGGFGQTASTGFGGASNNAFGQTAQTTGFGAAKPAGGLFGSTPSTTNTFGSSSTGGAFGQPAASTGTGLFGQQQQNAFGQPAANTSTGLFGQSNTSTGGFGQTNTQSSGFGGFGAKPATGFGAAASTPAFGQSSTGFGQTATAPASTGFGAFGQQQNQQAQPASTGLFGSMPSAAPASTGLFGQPATQPAATGNSLFGSTPAVPTSTGLFGQNQPAATSSPFGAAVQPASSTGLFGQQATQPAASTGLFGSTAAKPATGFGAASTGTGLFGQPAATTAPASTGLFGQPTATIAPGTGGGLFGSTPAASTGTGLFGSTATAPRPATNLFGSTGTSGFGAQTAAPATNSLFGVKPAAPAMGLFGSTSTAAPAQQLGNSLFASTAQQPAQQSLTASVDQNPYGGGALFQYSGQKLELSTSQKKPALPPLTASSYRVTPSKGRTTQLRGFSSPLNASQSMARSSSPAVSSPVRLSSPAVNDRYKGLTDASLNPNSFLPRTNLKKLNVSQQPTTNGSDDPLDSVLGKSALKNSRNGSLPPTPDSVSRSPAARPQVQDTPTRRPQSTVPLEASTIVAASERPLKRGDYWCRPKLDTLRRMSHEQLCHIENFTAGRKGYGEVSFLEPVDLTGVPSLNDFLGTVIIVESQELIVYPEDDKINKPERGKGLNVPANISLEDCFPRDKVTRKAIVDPSDARFLRQVKRMKAVPETEFISFTEDGVWTFRVEHFSKYGLGSDSDEDDEDVMDEEETPRKAVTTIIEAEFEEEDDDEFMPPTKSMHDHDMLDFQHDSGSDGITSEYSDETMSAERDDEDEEEDDYEREWEQPLRKRLGVSGVANMRAMQASFYHGHRTPSRPTPMEEKRMMANAALRALERNKRNQGEAGFGDAEERVAQLDDRAVQRASFGEIARPPKLRTPCKYAKVSLAKSSVVGHEGVTTDSGLALGRSFGVSWGPNGELVHIGKICAPTADFASSPDPIVFIEQVPLLADAQTTERRRAERLLSLLLEHTEVQDIDDEPAAFTDTSIRFNQFAALFDAADRSHEASIWRLGQALFDEIDLRLPEETPDDVHQHVLEVRRKLALSKWLEDAVAPTVDLDLAKAGDNRPAKVFAFLTGNQVERAVQSALDGNDMRLATLLSQSGGSDVFRAEVQRQLDDWSEHKADAFIGYDYRKLYALLAGITDISPGDGATSPDVLVAEGLDWKRAFGLYLWHGCPFELSVGDVFMNYSAALKSAHSPARPLPPYLETPDGNKEWKLPEQPTDILYSLIRMYSDIGVPLDDVLEARNASPSPTDFRLPWHLYLLLRQALQKRDFADREEDDEEGFAYSATANQITDAYAAQLEEEGQWTWAAFVLLHLETAEARRLALRALLFRHPEPTRDEEAFLTDRLRIPPTWLHEARAAQLAAQGDAYREYCQLIPAGLADRAQRTLVGKLAPEAVLRDDHALLQRLCEALEPLQPAGWEYGGKLFLDYLELVTRVQPLMQDVLRAGDYADAAEARELAGLADNLLRVLQLLPALFPSKDDVQQVAALSGMLSELQRLASVLHAAGFIPRPPISDLMVDKDRLHLLQSAATESFERSLAAIKA
jgi:nuclear pore complex protein Nup98-Nup96